MLHLGRHDGTNFPSRGGKGVVCDEGWDEGIDVCVVLRINELLKLSKGCLRVKLNEGVVRQAPKFVPMVEAAVQRMDGGMTVSIFQLKDLREN